MESNTSVIYDYTESPAIRQMCPELTKLEYIKGVSRYDVKLNELLSKFLKTSKIKHKFEPINDTIMKHICYYNKTRKQINTICCDRFCKGKEYQELSFKYNDKVEKYKICKDMPVLVTQNLKEHDMFTMMEYKITDINDNKFLINDIWFDQGLFTSSFLPSYCNTVYKYQGSNINQPYAIHDTERMCKKQLYTSLSRATNIEYIHLDNTRLNSRYKTRPGPDMEIINNHFNSNYRNGKIYEIKFDNGYVYIGQTCDSLKNRLLWHLSNTKSQVYKFKHNKPSISLIINAPCSDKKSLEKVEARYIHEHSIKYSDKLINKRMNPIKKRKEVKYIAQMENEKELNDRIALLENKIKIKENETKQYFYFDTMIKNKRYQNTSRFVAISKENAYNNINKAKNELIQRLTIDLD